MRFLPSALLAPARSAAAMAQADIALIGLAVMGQNLILNMNDHGFVVCAFNRTVSKVDDFLANEAKGTRVVGARSLEEMVSMLKKPRRIILLVKAGQAVDDFIEKLVPLLDTGDIIIDGGNSEYRDTTRRCRDLKAKGILFVGSGVSGERRGPGTARRSCREGTEKRGPTSRKSSKASLRKWELESPAVTGWETRAQDTL